VFEFGALTPAEELHWIPLFEYKPNLPPNATKSSSDLAASLGQQEASLDFLDVYVPRLLVTDHFNLLLGKETESTVLFHASPHSNPALRTSRTPENNKLNQICRQNV